MFRALTLLIIRRPML